MEKLKRLNWTGFLVVLLISYVGIWANDSISSFLHGIILASIIGWPIGLVVLIFTGK